MDEILKAYLAGVLDADGYFTIKRSTYHMRVRGDASQPVFSEKIGMKQVTPIVIDILKEYFGGHRRIEKPSARNGKPLHAWSVTDKKAIFVAETLLPYLKIKRAQAEILLELRKSKDSRRKIQDGTFDMVHKSGKIITMPRRIVHPEEMAKRENCYIRIKSLNDTRPQQPILIGKGKRP